MQRCSPWRAFPLSVKHTRQASQLGGRVTSLSASKGRTAAGVRAIRYVIHPRTYSDEAQFGADMRSLCMGRARKHTGRPDVLGSDGTDVRKVPIYGADPKSCGIGHVAPVAGSLLSSSVRVTL